VINPAEPVPTYVHIDSFQFKPNAFVYPQPLTLSHHIVAVWAYYENNLIGEFDLPVTFPVLTDGSNTGKLELYPAVDIDGQNNTVDMYPFYQPDTSYAVATQPGKTFTYEPSTSYYSTVKPYYIANYGTFPLSKLVNVIGVPISQIKTDSLSFEGGAGQIYMNNPGDSSVDSSTSFVVSTGAAYIEFNYKCDVPFTVGVQSNLSTAISSTPYYLAGILPSSTWQKFYLNLTAFITTYPGSSYNLYINTELPAGQATGKVLLQNVQLITF